MFDDAERNQKKCFHFAQCGEDCPECTTGPTTPDVGDCLPKRKTFPPALTRPRSMPGREEGITCDMNRMNIIDVLFLDLLTSTPAASSAATTRTATSTPTTSPTADHRGSASSSPVATRRRTAPPAPQSRSRPNELLL